AALLLTTLHASVSGAPRVAAVPRTRRVAAREGVVGALAVSVGDVLVVELGQAGLEFGAGPHECPGRAIADAIVVAMCQELAAGGYDVDAETVTTDADGRPVAATLSRADSSGRQLESGS
ncbi:MAG: hypothetical protein Q7V62_00885, partial [Actinomycetota bacterium]|nr:hypothetical protein [Actinomycetota bacterium]